MISSFALTFDLLVAYEREGMGDMLLYNLVNSPHFSGLMVVDLLAKNTGNNRLTDMEKLRYRIRGLLCSTPRIPRTFF